MPQAISEYVADGRARSSFHSRRPHEFAVSARLAELRRRRPDAKRWLEVLDETLASIASPAWGRLVSVAPRQGTHNGHPLLDGATLTVDADLARRHAGRLVFRAATGRSSRSPEAAVGHADAVALLEAAIRQDALAIAEAGERVGLGPDVARAVVPLVALPVLHACRAAWAPHVAPHWAHAYCPVCGAWPTLAEERGLERTRRFRCFRCGCDWHTGPVRCPYCGNGDAAQLGALIPADSPETRKVETCKRCLGYVKSVATLRACPPAEIGLLDLDTIELDRAAAQHGHMRPSAPGHAVEVTIVPAAPRGRITFRRR